MNFQIRTYSLFVLCLICVSSSVSIKFNTIYSLGDSITDTGRTYALTGHAFPPDSLYYKGRFSNGITWVEYLSKSYGAKLISYAYGKATTDNDVFRADEKLNIPGCIQQADMFLNQPIRFPETTLMTLAFFGNDFFNPKATPTNSMINLDKCIRKVAPKIKHLLIPISFAPELLPYYVNQNQTVIKDITTKSEEVRKILEYLLPKLREEFPKVQFYGLDFRGFLKKLTKEKIPGKPNMPLITKTSCISSSGSNNGSASNILCKNPEDYAFYDSIHPTTSTHKKLADAALEILSAKV